MALDTPKKAGRPLRGAQKRIRTSFTLSPSHLNWLENEALSRGINKSELLDMVIDRFQTDFSQNQVRPGIAIPYKAIETFCKKNHIVKFMLFGSVLTPRFTTESDIDVLIEFEKDKKPGLFDMVKMQNDLSSIFGGRVVDLKTFPELSPYFRKTVINEAHTVYAH